MIRKGGGLAIIYITLDLWILPLNAQTTDKAMTSFFKSSSDSSIDSSSTESLAYSTGSKSATSTVSTLLTLTTTRNVSVKQTITMVSTSAFTLVTPSAVLTVSSLSNLTTSWNGNDIQTTINGTTVDYREGLHLSLGSTIGVFLAVVVMVTAGTLLLVYWRKKGMNCYPWKSYLPVRKRHSSTSSHGPLTTDDATFVTITEPPQERELFSIEDKDGGQNGRCFSSRKQSTDDDYFYDEIFEKSAFVDAATNRANKHLTVDDEVGDDDELTVPDLVFKTPTKF